MQETTVFHLAIAMIPKHQQIHEPPVPVYLHVLVVNINDMAQFVQHKYG